MERPTAIPSTGIDPRQSAYLRVKAEQVTRLLDLVGELGLAAAEIIHHPTLQNLELEGFENSVHRLENLIRDLQEVASGLRLVPIGTVFRRMQRLVRDLSHQTGKPLELTLEGGETKIDKNLVDQLHDPLIHLVRNAVDHGIEPPRERIAAGKPETGQIILTATHQGREIHVTVADDGRGLDREAILKNARAGGLIGPEETPDDETIWRYVFQSGLSTAREVSSLSGRGVGLDAVQDMVQSLRGRIMIDTLPGEGTVFSLCIPLTLAFLDSLVVRIQGRLYAVPIDAIGEIVRSEPGQIVRSSANDSELVRIQDQLTPIRRLHHFYGDNGKQRARDERGLVDQIIVVIRSSRGAFGLPVDEIVGQQQVTMKPLQGPARDIRAGAGYALLGSGDVAIALDCEQLGQEFIAS